MLECKGPYGSSLLGCNGARMVAGGAGEAMGVGGEQGERGKAGLGRKAYAPDRIGGGRSYKGPHGSMKVKMDPKKSLPTTERERLPVMMKIPENKSG